MCGEPYECLSVAMVGSGRVVWKWCGRERERERDDEAEVEDKKKA